LPELPEPPPAPIPTPSGPSILDVTVAAFAGLGYALSARALLLLVLCGGFVLAMRAMTLQNLPGLEVLVAYCILVILPTVYLEVRKRSHGME
jgi:hypothetical protein